MNSSDGLFIPNGPSSNSTIHVSFNPSSIVDIVNSKNYDFKIQSTLAFDYWEDKNGLGDLNEEYKKRKSIPIIGNYI